MPEPRRVAPANLIVFGLALVAAALLLQLVAWAITIAIPAGILLAVIGVIWHLLGGSKREQQD